MHCPFCGTKDTKVIDSRLISEGQQVRRRRECVACSERYTTFEVAELLMPRVIKSDGRREPFNEEKVNNGLQRAIEKRPVSVEQTEQILNKVKSQLRATCEREVSSKLVGQLIMDQLLAVDKVAYVRFASVYQSFDDIEQFTHAISQIGEKL